MLQTDTNFDPAEIAKFEELAHRWWDSESEFKPLHDINPLRLNYIDTRAPLAGKKVLDVGCGGGILAESMAMRGAQVTGIDLGEAPLSVAKLHLLESNIQVDYQHISAEAMAKNKPQSYDIITCMEMLEHVPDPSITVSSCATMLKPEGQLFFSTLNRNPKSFLFAILGAEYLLRLLPKGTHEYAKFIRPSELSRWVRQADLEVRDITGLIYNPITHHYRLDDDTDVNYLLHARKNP